MRVCLRHDVGRHEEYELSVERDALVFSNERETLHLNYWDMDRFWFRRFGSSVVAFVVEMSGMVYEGNFSRAADAKRFTEKLNTVMGDSMDVVFNMNRDRSLAL